MVDVARDQRWGRGVEGGGEDVLLGNLFAAARVQGFQGTNLKSNEHFLATAKHFAAYGAAEAGLDYNTVDMSERTLREVYLPPYKAALDAGALSVMASFNEISGIPATGNRWLMRDVLRGEWKFDGFVVSDYTGDEEMIAHGYAKDGRDAARIALLAGVDMSMQSGLYRKHLPDLVRAGEVPEAVLNEFGAQGARDEGHARPVRGPVPPHRREARDRALHASEEPRSSPRSRPQVDRSPQERWRPAASAEVGQDNRADRSVRGRPARPRRSVGASMAPTRKRSIWLPASAQRSRTRTRSSSSKAPDVEKPIAGGIEAAVAAAQQADIVVLAIGEAQGMSGEAQSRTEIVVPKPQQDLAEAVAKVGKPIVVVLKHGRALALEGAVANAPAILATWFLGTETGHSIADVLFGAYSPSGRLPASFPRRSGQQPYYYAHKRTGRPNADPTLENYKARFRDITNSALYPFGHGLTYGKIAYGDFTISAPSMGMNGEITVTARITNSGRHTAEEVVQLYIARPRRKHHAAGS